MPREHIERLRWVFNKLVQAGLKLKPKKCEFFNSKISYLGHIVSSKGIETDPKRVEAVKNWVVPKTVTDIRSFLGFTNYYRRFIKDYAKVVKLLNALISGQNTTKKKKPSDIVCKSSQIITEKMTTEQWKMEQANDETISQVIEAMKASSGEYTFSSELAKQMFRFRNKFVWRHGLLYKKYFDINLQEERMQFMLPKKYWS